MKKIVLITFLFIITISYQVRAQASYGDMAWGSYKMEINVVTVNDSVFLNIVYTDEKRKLVDAPKLLIKLMDDEVILLDGQLLGNMSKSDGGVVISGIYIATNHFISEAKFPITRELISRFSKGIKKIRLNTSPKYHEKEWRKDRNFVRFIRRVVLALSKMVFDGIDIVTRDGI